jgi:hypothetical protein
MGHELELNADALLELERGDVASVPNAPPIDALPGLAEPRPQLLERRGLKPAARQNDGLTAHSSTGVMCATARSRRAAPPDGDVRRRGRSTAM